LSVVTLGLFRGLRWLFVRIAGREPRDTFLNWKPELRNDRFFDFTYFVFGTSIVLFVPILDRRLAPDVTAAGSLKTK
jgi:hypothetical protein